ncbi:uncharacterized protein PODANS_4_4380 [Podospora anserina S mat+]|uniref:Podospora anserina S mat+ genomic DNA chromosome 4, supercontig 4 n=1 Tax=Podospora anserina (strain S / ATCC MYA-4624 / DSM 980 / FGSC 10383) TaxID=515849 RepID=B2AQE9_PODAN|nr:uncharacterized protein PODANS_4_4380 [Podospora anserina S mat+]CAP67089.1 unnamed protein product [Podospora anserina S mat+]CDP28831.1 Putative protein of unknown function [Podospora anserina S mat+]
MWSILHLAVISAAFRCISASTDTATKPAHPPLNITALSSHDGYSVLECWQLASLPVDAMQAANYVVGGQTTKAVWSRIEPRTHIGEAWAPHAQLSIILNGLIRITSPAPRPTDGNGKGPLNDSVMMSIGHGEVDMGVVREDQEYKKPETKTAYILPGTLRSSMLIAADLKSISTLAGHYTEFPSDEPTLLVQIPFDGDVVPEHIVLYEGGCH